VAHWTSHAFHATVVSPRMMYEDVTMGFSDGAVTFTGRPLRNWRAWSWLSLVVGLVVFLGGVVVLASVVATAGFTGSMTPAVLVRAGAVVAGWVVLLWGSGALLRRYALATRMQSLERTAKLPLRDVSMARLSGRTLSIRAPFDHRNGSDRWRLRVDSHDQGESLLALLGRH